MTELAKKFGQPAPELTPMKVWRYGGPVKLADLRGSIVLLTFWGSTDADQGRQLIPTLQDLHEEYHDHGLRIVALHDATIKNEARFDEKLNILLRKDWENRQPEFPIALDVGGLKRGRSLFDWHVVGNNAHAYGVHHPPVSILIDREGKLLREIHPQVPLMQFELGRMLGVEAMLAVEPA
jgi:peroxiredoxin